MKRFLLITTLVSFALGGCIAPGLVKKQSAPGQVQKATGFNPASGKVKVKHKH